MEQHLRSPDPQLFQQKLMATLPLVTFMPTGNPLQYFTRLQREFFFDSVWRYLHFQRLEDATRTAALLNRRPGMAPVVGAGMVGMPFASQKGEEKKQDFYDNSPDYIGATPYHLQKNKEKEQTEDFPGEGLHTGAMQTDSRVVMLKKTKASGHPSGSGSWNAASSSPLFQKTHSSVSPGGGNGQSPLQGKLPHTAGEEQKEHRLGMPQKLHLTAYSEGIEKENMEEISEKIFGSRSDEVKLLESKLAFVIDDYARGDAQKAKEVLGELRTRLSSDNYKADDIMAVLLLVIEDRIWLPQEEGAEGSKHFGAASKAGVPVPLAAQREMQSSALVRLASVREMLRYYFERHPKEYSKALGMALGITADKEGDQVYLQERLAACLANIGSFALSQKILQQLKAKMDQRTQLSSLGYRYDRRGRRIMLGKRTSGRPGRATEAKGIMGLLMAVAKR